MDLYLILKIFTKYQIVLNLKLYVESGILTATHREVIKIQLFRF